MTCSTSVTAKTLTGCSPNTDHNPSSTSPNRDSIDSDPSEAIADAVSSLRRFADQCAAHGVTALVFASSAAVYRTDSDVPSRETDVVHADSPNASLKLRSEDALRAVSDSTPLSAVALRIFNAYGPGLDASLVNRLALVGTSTPGTSMTIANVGTGIGTSNRALLDLCPTASYRASGEGNVSTFSVADISLARRTWGFEPRIALRTALGHPEDYLR